MACFARGEGSRNQIAMSPWDVGIVPLKTQRLLTTAHLSLSIVTGVEGFNVPDKQPDELHKQPDELHELWVWAADEFLRVNEELKSHLDADVVALTQFVVSASKAVKQIRILGILGRAYISKSASGVKYIVFKGNQRLRPNLAGTRYAVKNPKVAYFVVGTEEIVEDAAKGTKIAIIAFVAFDVIKELREDKFSLASLGVRILSDVLQGIVAAGAGAAAGVLLTTIGAPVVAAFVIVVVVGFVAGVMLTELDRKFNLTERARAYDGL